MLRERRRRTIMFGSIEKKKIDTVSEANYLVNFIESEQLFALQRSVEACTLLFDSRIFFSKY